MIAAFLAYGFLALAIFYLQNLAFFPQMHLRLLALLLFYLGLRPSLALALALAVALGVLQDSFAITPFGLHLGRPCWWWAWPASLASVCPSSDSASRRRPACWPWSCKRSSCRRVSSPWATQADWPGGSCLITPWKFVLTAVLGPLMCLLVLGLERFLGRYGWRPRSQQPGFYQPLA